MQRRSTFEVVLLCRLLIRPTLSSASVLSHSIRPRAILCSDSHLLSSVNQPLLHWRDPLLFFHALLDALDLVVGLDVEFDLFAREGADSVMWTWSQSSLPDEVRLWWVPWRKRTYLICMAATSLYVRSLPKINEARDVCCATKSVEGVLLSRLW